MNKAFRIRSTTARHDLFLKPRIHAPRFPRLHGKNKMTFCNVKRRSGQHASVIARCGPHNKLIGKKIIAFTPFPVSLPHPYRDIYPFLLQALAWIRRVISGYFARKRASCGNNQWHPNNGTIAIVTQPGRATASKLRKLAMGGKSDMKGLPYLHWIYSGNLTIGQ